MGYVFGLLLKNPTAGKFLIFGFGGIFIYDAVKDAGLLASAVFVAGIISHHIPPFSIVDRLPRLSLGGRSSSERRDRSGQSHRQRKSKETTDQTHDRYAEFVNKNRSRKSEKKQNREEDEIHHRNGYTSRNAEYRNKNPGKDARGARRKKQDTTSKKAEADLKRDKERLQREKDRLKAEREEFERQQCKASKPAPDNRSDEQVLGLSGDYSLADLKKARNEQVKRWNTSNMVDKPPDLIQLAEEEAKKINLAYDRLSKQFR